MTVLPFILVLAFSAFLGWVLLVWIYAQTLLSPPRMTAGRAFLRLNRISPRDLGWSHKELAFTGKDGVRLAAWWIPAEGSRRTVVMLHGFGDAKVGALAWGPVWRELGFNLLLVDLRAHGESEGHRITVGLDEAIDLSRAIATASELFPAAFTDFALFGASYGAAVACQYAAGEVDARLRAIVLDSPSESFEEGAIAHAAQVGMPGPWIGKTALRLAQWRVGVKVGETAVVQTLPTIRVPTLVIVPIRDAYVSAKGRAGLRLAFDQCASQAPGSVFWEPDCTHLLAVNAVSHEYRQRLAAFVSRNVPD